ncbi:MAG: TraR/DksA C4-type zinc finger protein [Pseudomonadales bacterium]|nr:TraR/DksA C4-type zinc finger protein [Pseudomonadales bacterium]
MHTDHSASILAEIAGTCESEPVRKTRESNVDRSFSPYALAPKEEYMSETQRKHFSSILSTWEAALDKEAGQLAKTESEAGESKRMREIHRLTSGVRDALASISRGNYGYCRSCGAEMGIRYLEARPTATLCADCKLIEDVKTSHK